MKKFIPLLLAFVLMLCLLGGCSDEDAVFYTNIDGQSTTLIYRDLDSGRLIAGKDTYEFELSSHNYNTSLTLTYPDGQVATLTRSSGANGSVWVDGANLNDMKSAGYMSIYEVEKALERYSPSTDDSNEPKPSPLPALIATAAGLVMLFVPRAAWWLRGGWMFRDVEPSDFALGLYRVLGGIVAFAGVIYLIYVIVVHFA